MTKEPKIIYLQIGDDADIKDLQESDFEKNAITWCWEKIFDNDIEYVSKSQIIKLIDDGISDASGHTLYEGGYVDALNELKEKIQGVEK